MASVLEPIYTLFEMGMAFVESFRATANSQDSVGNFLTDWEAVLGRTQLTGITFRWRTVRAWKDRVVIAERIDYGHFFVGSFLAHASPPGKDVNYAGVWTTYKF